MSSHVENTTLFHKTKYPIKLPSRNPRDTLEPYSTRLPWRNTFSVCTLFICAFVIAKKNTILDHPSKKSRIEEMQSSSKQEKTCRTWFEICNAMLFPLTSKLQWLTLFIISFSVIFRKKNQWSVFGRFFGAPCLWWHHRFEHIQRFGETQTTPLWNRSIINCIRDFVQHLSTSIRAFNLFQKVLCTMSMRLIQYKSYLLREGANYVISEVVYDFSQAVPSTVMFVMLVEIVLFMGKISILRLNVFWGENWRRFK